MPTKSVGKALVDSNVHAYYGKYNKSPKYFNGLDCRECNEEAYVRDGE